MYKKIISILLFLFICIYPAFNQELVHFSPNEKTKIAISINEDIKMNIFYNDQLIVSNLSIKLDLKNVEFDFSDYQIEKKQQVIMLLDDPVALKFAHQEVEYSQLVIQFSNEIKWELMMSNTGIAYRWLLNFPHEVEITNEIMEFQLTSGDLSYFPQEESMISHYERLYIKTMVDTLAQGDFCSLPVLFKKRNNYGVLITESDLYNYPAMFLEKGPDKLMMKAVFPKVVLETKIPNKGQDRNQIVSKEAAYIAMIQKEAKLPWRVFVLTENDHELITNNMVYQLASPLKLENIEWIKPGKVAWDWWNDNNIYGVDFESGINNETYKYYIDFAAKYGLEYIILDEGWSKSTTDIMACQEDIDVQELVSYGKERNVGIILWTLWGPLDKNMGKALSLYESWGVKGVKVDFMQRADQYMVNYYERVAHEAAKHHLLVDFHGAFKPAGLRRAYPNVLNYEGLKGLENVKWSKVITPEHNLTLPFIRMVAGPMDYTPGAMDNAHESNFAIRWHRPMSMGTRCHQVAMYVVYESPLQMLCDNPSNYYREHETTEFISKIPTTWDETIVLEAKIGEYILMARRNGDTWYIGGMTVEAQEFQIDLSFLDENNYRMSFMQDGINSDRNAQDYSMGEEEVNEKSSITVSINKGGGFAAILKKK